MEKVWQANGTEKKNGIAILISGRIDVKRKPVRRDGRDVLKEKSTGRILQFKIYVQKTWGN